MSVARPVALDAMRCGSCGTVYVGPGHCPGCGTRAVLDFRTGKVTTFTLGRRIGEDPAAPLLRLCTLLDEASRDLQQQAAGAAHDKSEVLAKLAGLERLIADARLQYEEAIA